MSDLDKFASWLARRGRAQNTVVEYVQDIGHALEHPDGATGYLLEKVAPKTLHRRRAVLQAWAKFTEDASLRRELDDIQLPSVTVRVQKAIPLEKQDWLALRAAIDKDRKVLSEPERGVLGLLATRGFRVGDVLQMRRTDIASAMRDGVLRYKVKRQRVLEWSVLKSFDRYLEILLEFADRWHLVMDLVSPSPARGDAVALDIQLKRSRSRMSYALSELGRLYLNMSRIGRLHPHRLRRTYSVFYLRELQKHGRGLEDLQAHMQWAELQTAASYVDHARREELDKFAISMERSLMGKE